MHNTETPQLDAPCAAIASPASRPVPWREYQAANLEWFRSPDSFRWFQQQHATELTKAGALAIIAGRVYVVPDAFDRAVIAIGQRLAAARAA